MALPDHDARGFDDQRSPTDPWHGSSAHPSETASAPLPDSLRGTQIDGALVTDAEGKFVPTADAIDLFDYFLSAVGEESLAAIRARIRAAITSRLDGPAAEKAMALLDDYLRYRDRAAQLIEGPILGEDLDRRLQYLRELRREVFGAETARALFAQEEERWFVELERRRVLMDATLGSAERDQRLAALEADLPPEWVASQRASLVHKQLRQDEARLRAEGEDASEVERLREERFGYEAATRLSELDAARADWQRRLDAYRNERDAALANAETRDHDAIVAALREAHFEGGERIRVRALDAAKSDSTAGAR